MKFRTLLALFLLQIASFTWAHEVSLLPPMGNTMCPVMTDRPVMEGYSVDYNGKAVGVCCESCIYRFSENPERYMHHLEDPLFYRELPSAKEPAIEISKPFYVELYSKLHVVIVHFPIALIVIAGIMELIACLYSNKKWSEYGFINLNIGLMAMLLAVSSGWVLAGWPGDYAPLENHRWFALGAMVASFIAWYSYRAQRGASKPSYLLYRITLWLSAILVLIAAHWGGILVHGVDYLSF